MVVVVLQAYISKNYLYDDLKLKSNVTGAMYKEEVYICEKTFLRFCHAAWNAGAV